MEIGIDSFAGAHIDPKTGKVLNPELEIQQLLDRMVYADEMGLDSFAIGEHYRKEFLDSANIVILAAAAARTKRIKLSSAVTVLSSADPVRVFQNFATLDLISNGRAEIVVGRGSFTDSFPLFGYNLNDYHELFEEKLELLLKFREEEVLTWNGKFRSPLVNQAVYPRPLQQEIPIYRGVGGSSESFHRAGKLGMPLMAAVIGGQTERFRPMIDLYRQSYLEHGHPKEKMKIGLHSLGFLDDDHQKALDIYYPGYAKMFNDVSKERGWPPVTREGYDHQTDKRGALVVGDPIEVADKILRHSEALGGIDRFTFNMDNTFLSHEQLMHAIELIGKEVIPRVNEGIQSKKGAPSPSIS
ncbi:putative LLM family oxidoreductase [Catalinimonas alkaloidigena]|uniref:Atu2307/SP_0267 family LLM class monooxygenase n=1 Tax=Catalinimonas alkaloidigena TaxID=1075417 RepID=UPI002405344B|nr:Atu2307/SP_0267 family LLM class monooxygenase [Catalinimonas alkaloidigena]MDF9796853.1 putative LLM family oxidoreductase [Catalinimonas alkaloidigena]